MSTLFQHPVFGWRQSLDTIVTHIFCVHKSVEGRHIASTLHSGKKPTLPWPDSAREHHTRINTDERPL